MVGKTHGKFPSSITKLLCQTYSCFCIEGVWKVVQVEVEVVD